MIMIYGQILRSWVHGPRDRMGGERGDPQVRGLKKPGFLGKEIDVVDPHHNGTLEISG